MRKGLLSPQEVVALPHKRVPSFNWDYRMENYPGGEQQGQACRQLRGVTFGLLALLADGWCLLCLIAGCSVRMCRVSIDVASWVL